MAEDRWNGKERRAGADRRESSDRRTQERIWERRSGQDRRGHPLYGKRPSEVAS